MPADQQKDWRTLCKAVVKETDPDRFMALVIELNDALDERERRRDGILHKRADTRASLLSGCVGSL